MGMGRGPGNTKTEELINFLEKEKFLKMFQFLILLLYLIFLNCNKNINGEQIVLYKLSGKYRIHPTYIKICYHLDMKKDDYFKAIKYLKNNDAKSYNPFAFYHHLIFIYYKKNYSTKKKITI